MKKIKIYARDIDMDMAGDESKDRYIDTCICDNINRALEMYDDEKEENEILVYKHIE